MRMTRARGTDAASADREVLPIERLGRDIDGRIHAGSLRQQITVSTQRPTIHILRCGVPRSPAQHAQHGLVVHVIRPPAQRTTVTCSLIEGRGSR